MNGGCTAKLGPGALDYVLKKLDRIENQDLLVGYEHADDAAVFRLTADLAIVQTLDFFPPMVDDPYLFGQIAAANALSDIYAMGGEVRTALNIVCFPEKADLDILGAILKGGAEKVAEAGGVLAGGHSIADNEIKYGLSVTGVIHPDKILKNNKTQPGDLLILTKPLGVGIIAAASRVGEASPAAMASAAASMSMLNRYAAEAARAYRIHACTDVTGYGFLGHLNEMLGQNCARIHHDKVPFISEACQYADEFLLTAAGQRNRKYLGDSVTFLHSVDFATEELLFDPQTSGGLLLCADKEDAPRLLEDIKALGLGCGIVGEIMAGDDNRIVVD